MYLIISICIVRTSIINIQYLGQSLFVNDRTPTKLTMRTKKSVENCYAPADMYCSDGYPSRIRKKETKQHEDTRIWKGFGQ
jgi:hypothetical protein